MGYRYLIKLFIHPCQDSGSLCKEEKPTQKFQWIVFFILNFFCLGGLGSRVCLTARMEQGTFNNCLSCPEIFVLVIRRLLPR